LNTAWLWEHFKTISSAAQLSQRDRAAAGQKSKTGTGRQFYRHYRSIFNRCDVGHQLAIEFGEKRKIRAMKPFKVIQGHRGQSTARM